MMQRLNGKVTSPPSLLQDICSFANFFIPVLVALTARLEPAEKALLKEGVARLVANQSLAEEKASWQIADQSLWVTQEASAALNWDLQSAKASIITTKERLSSKLAALDGMVIREREAQIKLETIDEERKVQKHQLESAQRALPK
jgi:hypothetical protein